MPRLADSANKLQGQEMFQILAKARELEKQGKSILHFELGDPHFDTPDIVKKACYDSINQNETHYVPSMGIKELREAIADRINQDRGFKPDIDQVLISAGANPQLYYALKCAVNPGEEVIVPDPGFVSYYSIIDSLGIKAVKVPTYEENEFRLNPEDVRKAITDKTKMIIINSPNNPTGAVMTKEEIKEIYDLAEQNDIYLLSDEVYSKILYDDEFFSPSIYDQCKKRTILVNGFSKEYAMTGWRLGYAVGPSDLICKMGLLLETNSSCTPPFIQRAGIEALRQNQDIIKDRVEKYKEMRDIIVNGLNNIPGITCLNPKGAFYVFPNIKETGMSSREFADFAIEAGVAIAPGDIFGDCGQGYVRFSYSTTISNIQEAVERLRSALEKRNIKEDNSAFLL